MILDRHLIREVAKRLVLVAVVLEIIFAAYVGAQFLARASSGLLQPRAVAELVALKSLIASEVVIPVALYVSVILAFERWRSSHQLVALSALGFGPRRASLALLRLFLPFALAVGIFSLWGRPATYAALYDLEARAEAAFDLGDVEEGRFYPGSEGSRVVFVGQRDPGSSALRDVFVWIDRGSSALLITAQEIERVGEKADGTPQFRVRDMSAYRLDAANCALKARADRLLTSLDFGGMAPVGYKRKAAPSWYLWSSRQPKDVAELQWRLTRVVSALLLGCLAVRLARSPALPGRRLGRVILALLACVAYQLLSVAAKNWVEDGVIPEFPGLWWVDGFLALLLLSGFPWLESRRLVKAGGWRARPGEHPG